MNPDVHLTFAAIASRPRRQIVRRLTEGRATISQLRASLDVSKQAMTRHVAQLEQAGIVRRVQRGRHCELEFVASAFDEIQAWIDERRRAWATDSGRLATGLGGVDEASDA